VDATAGAGATTRMVEQREIECRGHVNEMRKEQRPVSCFTYGGIGRLVQGRARARKRVDFTRKLN
jgi:hypothetical protein